MKRTSKPRKIREFKEITPPTVSSQPTILPASVIPAENKPGLKLQNISFLRDEFASVIDDYILQYIGVLTQFPAPASGIIRNQDKILETQWRLDVAGYDLYDEIERDAHVFGIYDTIKIGVSQTDWNIYPPYGMEKDAKSQKLADWVQTQLANLPMFLQDIVELLDANAKGFATSEIIRDVNSKGEVIPVDIMNRPQRRCQFDANTRWLKIRTKRNPYYGEPVPAQKFIIHRNSQKYENPFGDALNQRLYWNWFFKHNIVRFYSQFLETSAGPIPYAKFKEADGADEDFKTRLLSFVKNIRTGGYGIIPDSVELLWNEVKTTGAVSEAYDKALRFFDDQMTKCVLGEVLTTEGSASGGSGARAGASESRMISKARIERAARMLADTLTHSLIKWMVEWNFPDVKDYPRFQFETTESVDQESISKVVLNLKNAGFTPTREWIEETFGLELEEPKPEPDRTIIPIAGTIGQPNNPAGQPIDQEGIAA